MKQFALPQYVYTSRAKQKLKAIIYETVSKSRHGKETSNLKDISEELRYALLMCLPSCSDEVIWEAYSGVLNSKRVSYWYLL